MSQISTVFGAIHTRLETLLPDHTRIGDPYDLEANNELFLRQGYGVSIGPGAFENEGILAEGCKTATSRTFDIHVMRKFYALENDGPLKDTTALQIMEDLAIIVKDFLLEETLNDNATITDYESDSGIFKVIAEKDNFLAATISITVRYRDLL